MSFRSSISSSRRSAGLCAAWVAAGTIALALSPIAPEAYFGGRRLAEQFEGLAALAEEREVEVIVVGDSYVVAGFDPGRFAELTGLTAFDFGIVGSDLFVQSLLVRHVLLPRFEPGTIVWCVGTHARRRTGMNEQYLASRAVSDSRGSLGQLRFDVGLRLPQHQRRTLLDWISVLSLPRSEGFDELGFRPNSTRLTPGATAVPPDEQPADTSWIARFALAHSIRGAARFKPRRSDDSFHEEEARAVFVEALRFARERGVRVVAYTSPFWAGKFEPSDDHARRILSGENDAHYRWLCATLAEFEVPYLNLRYFEPVSEDPQYFYDETHLNRWGAVPTTEMVARVFFLGAGAPPPELSGAPSPAERAAIDARGR